jgi:coenzyme F420-0:L-glutamate ligase/coenzyme F420-1:gamma-L-glutamate ligase
MSGFQLRPLEGLPEVAPGADLVALHRAAAERADLPLADGVLVVAQKIISKAEGRLVDLTRVTPGPEALRIAKAGDKDPRQIEVVLGETRRIVRESANVLICETRHGFVCANAGVDLSNAPDDDVAILLPVDPDDSARRLRQGLLEAGAAQPLAVIITDTFGRPWREGLVDVAIGCAGIAPLDDLRGSQDRRGRELAVTTLATVDALAAAAGLLMRKADGIPSVWVSGIEVAGDGNVGELVRDPEADLFR